MPANKAVIGAFAVAASAYKANEYLKDKRCREEEEEERQLREDRMEDLARRQHEAQMRKTYAGKKRRGARHNDDRTQVELGMQFQYVSGELLRGKIVELVEGVKKRAELDNGRRSVRLGPSASLHLLLLDTDRNSPDEVALGAALAFGNEFVVDDVLRAGVVQPSPGIALAKLSPSPVELIRKEMQRRSKGTVQFSSGNTANVSTVGVDLLKRLLVSAIFTDDHEKPLLQACRLSVGAPFRSQQKYKEQFQMFRMICEEVGFHLLPESRFSSKVTYRREDTRGGYCRIPVDCQYRLKGAKRGAFHPDCPDDWLNDEQLFITNFYGDFRVPFSRLDEVNFEADFQNISLFGKRSAIKSLSDDQMDVICNVMAAALLHRCCAVASERLDNVSKGQAVSLEHIAINSGFEGDVLFDLRSGTSEMISEHRSSIVSSLTDRLVECVPEPGRDWHVYWEEMAERGADNDEQTWTYGFRNESFARKASLERETELLDFIRNYTRLLDLGYCVVPLFNGRPPSKYVPSTNVNDDAQGFMYKVDNIGAARLTRKLEKDERKRLIRSRELSSPPQHIAFCCFSITWAGLLWFSFIMADRVVRMFSTFLALGPQQLTILLVVLSLIMSWYLLLHCLEHLRGMLNVLSTGEESSFVRAWALSSALAEVIVRRVSIWRGQGAPFERKVAELTQACRSTCDEWQHRCVTRDFYRALHRKKIASSDLNTLLMSVAHEDSMGLYMSAVLPGSESEGEEFLNIIIEESEEVVKSNEAPLDRVFSDIAEQLKKKMEKFPTGARVEIGLSDIFLGTDFDEGDVNESVADTALVLGRRNHGTVVSACPKFVLVRMDGEIGPIPVPSKFCTLADDVHDAGSDDDSDISSDESFVEECYNEDRARKALRRAIRKQERKAQLARENYSGLSTKAKIKDKTHELAKEVESKKTDKAETSKRGGNGKRCPSGTQPTDRQPKPKTKHLTVLDALKAGGWKLLRKKKHLVFKRKIDTESGEEQTFTMSKTPSDRRAHRNMLANLRKLDEHIDSHENISTASDEADQSPKSDGKSGRPCVICHEVKDANYFSKAQWKKGKSKCKKCVQKQQ